MSGKRKHKVKLTDLGWGIQSPNGRIVFRGTEQECRDELPGYNKPAASLNDILRRKSVAPV